MKTEYLKNTWYMAGWDSELDKGEMIARKFLDTPVVIFKDTKGDVQAIVDRCPHRFAPLSRGKLKGDYIECGYHGLGYNGEGKCVHNPYNTTAPEGRPIQSFPVVSRHKIVWIWFGDKELADLNLVPDFKQHEDPEMRFVFGHSAIKANYELIADNLMDLSHTTFIHPSFGGEFWVPDFKLEQEGDRIAAVYEVLDSPPSEFSEAFFAADGKMINEYTTMFWDMPGVMYLDIRWSFSETADKIVATQPSTHILTPESASKSWYFWASGAEKSAPVTDDEHREILVNAFEVEDGPMLEACERSMEEEEFWSRKPLILPYDAAAVRARRILHKHIKDEQKDIIATS